MHFVRTCIIIFILAFSFFSQSVSQKKDKMRFIANFLKFTKELERSC